MSDHKVVSHDEWLKARLEPLAAEKDGALSNRPRRLVSERGVL
jgi:predicted dithiol-disulfide oxidoreductase (DUF899 family)